MNPPPPIPHDCGRATFRAKTVATAASTALPPASSTPRPTRAAAGDSVAMTPSRPVTPGRNSDPCFARAGTAATPARATETTMTTRRTGGVLPHVGPRVRAMDRAREPRPEDQPGHQAGGRRRDVRERLVAQDRAQALGALDVAGLWCGERVEDGHRQARRKAGRCSNAEGELGDGMPAMPAPARMHSHELSSRPRRSFSA